MKIKLLKLTFLLFASAQCFGQSFELFDFNLSGDFEPKYFTEYNGMLIFQARSNDGVELWKSDGTQSGTVQIKNINVNPNESSDPKYFKEYKGKLYFVAMQQLWVTDGTENGTQMVSSVKPSWQFTIANDLLFFVGGESTNGGELWVTNGTESGTVMVKDINPGSWSSSISNLTTYNNIVVFSANDGVNGKELWKSDGTESGTKMILDIDSGDKSSSPSFLTEYAGKIYFSAKKLGIGTELWKTDGTASGTVLVKDIFEGEDSSNPVKLFVYSQSLFFQADSGDNHGIEMYKYNLTTNLVTREADVYDGAESGGFSPVIVYNEGMYFTASKPATGIELYVRRNGFNSLAEDIYPGSIGGRPSVFCNCGDKMYFRAYNGNNVLLEFSGVTNNAKEIKPQNAVNAPFFTPIPTELFCYNGSLYFAANYTSSGFDMWKYTPSTLSINKFDKENYLSIYPNPVKTNLTISLINDSNIQKIQLFNIIGQKVLERAGNQSSKLYLNVSKLQSGIYVLKTFSDSISISKRIVIE